jgi:hypothetical protein
MGVQKEKTGRKSGSFWVARGATCNDVFFYFFLNKQERSPLGIINLSKMLLYSLEKHYIKLSILNLHTERNLEKG